MRVEADDGRIYLPKALRDEFGDAFELIDRGDRLVLVPLPDDPLAALRDEAAASEGSVEELRERAREEGLAEAGE